MHIAPTAAAHPQAYTGPAKLAADNDGDGRKGVAALNDGDAAARTAQTAIAKSAPAASAPTGAVSVKA
jgi:hypothetical protein